MKMRMSPAPVYAIVGRNKALRKHGFEPKNAPWAWGGRNDAEGSVCFLSNLRDAVHGPQHGQSIVNLLNASDFDDGGNGFEDRCAMLTEMSDNNAAGYLLLYEEKREHKIRHVIDKLYVIVNLITSVDGMQIDAVVEAA